MPFITDSDFQDSLKDVLMDAFWKEKLRALPSSPGVYLMRDAGGKIIYIGKAINLKRRVSSYFRADVEDKVAAIVSSLRHIDYVLASSERAALILERELIYRYQPYFNSMWRDDKSYPYLKLTMAEDYPRLLLTRKVVKDGSEYFGPYPQVIQIKRLMRWMQRMFKWRPCRLEFDASHLPPEAKVKSCLYYHTERCAGPCMGKISPPEYRKVADEIRLFLRRNFKKLEDVWEREMRDASRELQFEKAADARDRLDAIRSIQERVTVRELKPEDLQASLEVTRTLEAVKDELKLPRWPVVIEGFDISNISGTQAVGSMVRFVNGQPDKSGYRKYRIKTVSGVDDYSMMREVVHRRYRRLASEKKELPDLILIDGGKGHLAAALESLALLRIKTPILSLAKEQEEIFRPGEPEPLMLPRTSPALQLLQRVRDESHRFALAYHHVRRRNALGIKRAKPSIFG